METQVNLSQRRNIQEARKKLGDITIKLQEFDVRPSDVSRLQDFLIKYKVKSADVFPIFKVLVGIFVFFVLWTVYSWGFLSAAWYLYQDWKFGGSSGRTCAVALPDVLARVFRPPVHCSMCEDVSDVDRVSEIAPDDFEIRYAYSGRPVIIMDATESWSAPRVFTIDFFRDVYRNRIDNQLALDCQFFPYQTSFHHLGEFMEFLDNDTMSSSPWYVGWSNCDREVAEILRSHYDRPYFLPSLAEGKRLDWIFMGSRGYGAPLHVDNVEFPSWQAQLRGEKKWQLVPPPECFYDCQSLEVTVRTGEILVLDTNRWYHSTEIISDEISITIGAEYD